MAREKGSYASARDIAFYLTLSSYLSSTSCGTSAEMSRRGFPIPKRIVGMVLLVVVGSLFPSKCWKMENFMRFSVSSE